MKAVYLILLCFVSIAGCVTYNINENYIKGQWTDFVEQRDVLYFAQDKIYIQFAKDSFYYFNTRWTDAFTKDTCQLDSGFENAAGIYKIINDSLILNGYWTDKTYRNIKTSGCYNIGSMQLIYKCTIMEKKKVEMELLDENQNYKSGVKKKILLFKQ